MELSKWFVISAPLHSRGAASPQLLAVLPTYVLQPAGGDAQVNDFKTPGDFERILAFGRILCVWLSFGCGI